MLKEVEVVVGLGGAFAAALVCPFQPWSTIVMIVIFFDGVRRWQKGKKIEDLERLVIFAILMENPPEGIRGKAPKYILEKFDLAMTLERPEALLDMNNTRKLEEWRERWIRSEYIEYGDIGPFGGFWRINK